MQSTFVETPQELQAVVARALERPRIAIDLEGDGYFRYRARVCTLQMNLGDELVVVDTLKCWEPSILGPLLGPQGPQKILHDAAFDARLLWAQDVELGNVFDTALAARLLSAPATGLSSLLSERLEVAITKDQQQADWGRRPLDAEALRYLHDDVRHLFDLADSLEKDVIECDIAAELRVECEYMLGQARKTPGDPPPPWLRIKAGRKSPPLAQAVLREAAALRERVAAEWDVPPFRVTHDRMLVELAKRRPTDVAGLKAIRGLLSGRGKGLAQAWLAAVDRGVKAGRVPVEDLAEPGSVPDSAERARRKRLEKALSKWRGTEATARNVDIQVVLPGHGVKALVGAQPQDAQELAAIEGLGDVRIERYGAQWLALVAATAEAPNDPEGGR